MCNENRETNNCICEILKVIYILQQNTSCNNTCCLETCDSPILNCSPISICQCNTRPVTLYTCSGTLWTFPISRTGTTGETSSVFRIEKLDDCCATFRVLAPNTDPATVDAQPFIATDSFFTIDLGCVCAIKCLRDTFIDTL